MNKAAHAYFKTNVSTTDQGHLLIMLYDGALKFLQQAREKMLAKDYAAKGLLISKVIDIINELAGSLNMEKGGSLATNLNNLYFLCTARLLQANLKLDLNALDSVVKIIEGLRSAYAEIVNRPEAKSAVQQISQRMQPVASVNKRAQPLMTGSGSGAPVSGLQARAAYGRMMQSQASPASPAEQPQPAMPNAAYSAQNFVSQPGMQNGMMQNRLRSYGQM
ncbi:MAG: flagellar export chaperone FliS [Desulfovibrio sp.]|nr:flagellar export chaperone FliS [Desulfovibrio sp.]